MTGSGALTGLRQIDQTGVAGLHSLNEEKMPNWCANRLVISGDSSELDKFEQMASSPRATYAGENPQTAVLPLSLHGLFPVPPDILALGVQAAQDWQSDNWGTKWELDRMTRVIRRGTAITYRFESAWGPPLEWLIEVAARFRQLRFDLSCSGYGFSGRITFVDGVETEWVSSDDEGEFCSD